MVDASLKDEMEAASKDIGAVLTSMGSRFNAELLATPESELTKRWHFQWDGTASIEWNIYQFSGSLESFKRDCRRWEEHHNGCCCVVERVRDKYLMPQIRAFMTDLTMHNREFQGGGDGGNGWFNL